MYVPPTGIFGLAANPPPPLGPMPGVTQCGTAPRLTHVTDSPAVIVTGDGPKLKSLIVTTAPAAWAGPESPAAKPTSATSVRATRRADARPTDPVLYLGVATWTSSLNGPTSI